LEPDHELDREAVSERNLKPATEEESPPQPAPASPRTITIPIGTEAGSLNRAPSTNYQRMRVAELRDLCESYNLDTSGTKSVLTRRLKKHSNRNAHAK
jgi:hypothetical protein